MSRLLSVEEVASLLNVPRKWVYRRVGLKPPEGIPYLKVQASAAAGARVRKPRVAIFT